jgi:hypothetical protein
VDFGLKGRRAGAMLAFATLTTIAMSKDGVARGTEVAIELGYDVPPGCPAAEDFKALVDARLGYDPFRIDAAEQVIIRIERAGSALEGRLEWRNAAGSSIGEHTFPSRTGDCGELVRAMGFALALQLQLMAVAASSAQPPDGSAGVTPTPGPAPPVAASTAPPPPQPADRPPTIPASASESSPASFAVGAGAAVGVGLSPSAVAIGRLFGAVAWSRFGLELAAEVSPPSTTYLMDGSGFSQQELLAGLAGCLLGRTLSACLLAKAGEIRVTGQGLAFPAASSALVLQGGLRVAVTHMLGSRAYIVAHGDGVTMLTRGVITVDSMPVWTTPRVAAVFGVDVGVRFR